MADPTQPQNYEELLAVMDGEDLATYRRFQADRDRLRVEAEGYLHLPPAQWPRLRFNWDLRRSSQRFAYDGMREKDWRKNPSEDFRVGWVELPRFDAHLCRFSRRDGDAELWEVGSATKLAFLIAYLAHGRPITPPIATIVRSGIYLNQFAFGGGNHRYAIAKAVHEASIPVFVDPASAGDLEARLPVRWDTLRD